MPSYSIYEWLSLLAKYHRCNMSGGYELHCGNDLQRKTKVSTSVQTMNDFTFCHSTNTTQVMSPRVVNIRTIYSFQVWHGITGRYVNHFLRTKWHLIFPTSNLRGQFTLVLRDLTHWNDREKLQPRSYTLKRLWKTSTSLLHIETITKNFNLALTHWNDREKLQPCPYILKRSRKTSTSPLHIETIAKNFNLALTHWNDREKLQPRPYTLKRSRKTSTSPLHIETIAKNFNLTLTHWNDREKLQPRPYTLKRSRKTSTSPLHIETIAKNFNLALTHWNDREKLQPRPYTLKRSRKTSTSPLHIETIAKNFNLALTHWNDREKLQPRPYTLKRSRKTSTSPLHIETIVKNFNLALTHWNDCEKLQPRSWLVSTHVVCERLSVMQQQAGLQEFLAHIAKITLFLSSFPLPQPPPPKWKVGHNLALWLLTTQEYPHPLPKTKSWPELGTFRYDYPRMNINPSENEKLARTWHFEFWLAKNTPPKKSYNSECVETNRYIPQGYRLVWLCTTDFTSEIAFAGINKMQVSLMEWCFQLCRTRDQSIFGSRLSGL